ncbi:MAG TPA: hypothetical protein VHB79_20655 [Polyangiaceae bacterium]|nr:hypothetical protein [Polyangiaceae bacterium]
MGRAQTPVAAALTAFKSSGCSFLGTPDTQEGVSKMWPVAALGGRLCRGKRRRKGET